MAKVASGSDRVARYCQNPPTSGGLAGFTVKSCQGNMCIWCANNIYVSIHVQKKKNGAIFKSNTRRDQLMVDTDRGGPKKKCKFLCCLENVS